MTCTAMTCTTLITLGLSRTGKLVITVGCGCSSDFALEVEMQPQEAHQFVQDVNALIAVGARVQSLPLPWMHDPGSA